MTEAVQTNIVEVESRFFKKAFYAFLAVVVLSFLISMLGRKIGSEISMGGHTNNTNIREIIIGNDVLNISENTIRYPEQRRDGIAKRVDLYVQWPEMTGFSKNSKAIFNNLDPNGKLMFISFERRSMMRDMSGRFEPIYKPMLEGSGQLMENGLIAYKLSQKAGFTDEYLYVATRPDNSLFVARCLNKEAAASNLAPCERDIHVGEDLVMMVRFSANLLSQWQNLDKSAKNFADSIVR